MVNHDITLKVIVIGDSCVGKSSLMRRVTDNTFNNEFSSTIGVDFKSISININDYNIKLQVWDTAGQEKFKNIIPIYFRGSAAALICFDITSRKSFENLDEWIEIFNTFDNKSTKAKRIIIG